MTREEAIKWLSDELRFPAMQHVKNDSDRKKKIAVCRMAIEALREQEERRWIPVTERLPEPGERVLATDGGFVGEFYVNSRGQWKRYNVNDHSLLMALDILLWMPLPEPPKEGV